MDSEAGPSGLKLRPRKDRRHAAKPYARPETFVNKITSTVTQIIPEWIKTAAQLFKPDDLVEDDDDEPTENTQVVREDRPVAEQPSASHSNIPSSKTAYSVPHHQEPASLEAQRSKRLSSIKIQRVEPPETASTSRPPVVGTTIEVDDGDSSSSENTASSTSGCSSLVPSHQDNLQRLHLPKSSLDRLRQELMKTSDQYTRSAASAKDDNSSRNSSSLWMSRTGNREFDASRFLASSSTVPFPARTVTSPFYPGATKFGGASARRVEMLTSSPYNLNQRKMAPILRVKANETTNHNLESQDKMSSAARKFWNQLTEFSSPLEEAKKMPLRGRPAPNSSRGPCFITDRLNLSQSLRPSTSSGMSHTAFPVIINPPTSKNELPSITAKSITNRINCNLSSVDSSMNRQAPNSIITSFNSLPTKDGGGKIKSAKSSGRVSLAPCINHDGSNDVKFDRIELPPIKSLPSFKFDGKPEPEPVKKKKGESVIVNNVEGKFSFLQPFVRSRHLPPYPEKLMDTFKFPLPTIRHSETVSSAPLIQPFASSNAPKETNKTETSWGAKFKPAAGSWDCPCCMITNKADSSKCAACETVKP